MKQSTVNTSKNNQNSSYEQSGLTLLDLIQFVFQYWKRSLLISLVSVAAAVGFYNLAVPFEASTNVLINDSQNSQLQAFTNNFFGLSKTSASTNRKGGTPATKAVEMLRRPEVMMDFLRFLSEKRRDETWRFQNDPILVDLGERIGFNYDLKSDATAYRSAAKALLNLIELSPGGSGLEIRISVSAKSPEVVELLSRELGLFAVDTLKRQEQTEIEKVKLAIEKQRDHFKGQFMKTTGELAEFQRRPENVLSLASNSSISTYLSDLMVRKNEIELKIAENQRAIEFLGGQKALKLAAKRNLGGRSQIQQLVEQVGLLKKQAQTLQDSINKFVKKTSGSAETAQMFEELKKTADSNFKSFQESNNMLSKLGVYQVSIENKFEVQREVTIEDIRPKTSMVKLLFVGLFMGQIIFAALVYFEWLKRVQALARRRPPEEMIHDEVRDHAEAGQIFPPRFQEKTKAELEIS